MNVDRNWSVLKLWGFPEHQIRASPLTCSERQKAFNLSKIMFVNQVIAILWYLLCKLSKGKCWSATEQQIPGPELLPVSEGIQMESLEVQIGPNCRWLRINNQIISSRRQLRQCQETERIPIYFLWAKTKNHQAKQANITQPPPHSPLPWSGGRRQRKPFNRCYELTNRK